MNEIPKTLILWGFLLIVAGLIAALFLKTPWLGKLPGDILIRKGNFQFFFPLTTSLVISLILTLVLFFLKRK